MLSKLRRLYRGLCWLMDTDCGMPWDMADLGEIRGRVAVLEEQHRANAGTWCRLFDLETNVGDHKQAVHKRLAYLEDWLRSLDVRVDAQEAEAHRGVCDGGNSGAGLWIRVCDAQGHLRGSPSLRERRPLTHTRTHSRTHAHSLTH